MKLQLSKEAQAILDTFQRDGISASAGAIYRKSLPHRHWWQIVSRSAKSGDPYWTAIKELSLLMLAEPDLPPWPEGLWETEDTLPPVSQQEAVALTDRFLRAEAGALNAGVQLHPLHWDLLAAHYCPLRERYIALKQLCAQGLLAEAAGGSIHQESGLHWPLTVTEACLKQIRRGRFDARLPAFRRAEDFLADVSSTYPLLSKAVTWLILGGGLATIINLALPWLTK